jgi:hypothetical protein
MEVLCQMYVHRHQLRIYVLEAKIVVLALQSQQTKKMLNLMGVQLAEFFQDFSFLLLCQLLFMVG